MSGQTYFAAHPPIGIDLGTTFSAIGYLDAQGQPATIRNDLGRVLTPSVVGFSNDEVIVGEEAARLAMAEPQAAAECFKRDMGREYFRRPILDQQVPPEVIGAWVLAQLKQDAERMLGPVAETVITVPAFFDEARRRATQEAGRLAGWNVVDVINEPTAAALAYAFRAHLLGGPSSHGRVTRVLVYDLGGGTFDATVLEIRRSNFRTLATDGDVQLGGKDFDERIVNYVAEAFVERHGLDPREDALDCAELWHMAERAKLALTTKPSIPVVCRHANVSLELELTRAWFESQTADLLARTQFTVEEVVRQAKLTMAEVDVVLLVGGASRMPMVARMLEATVGRKPDRSMPVEEAVVQGAVLYAAFLAGNSVRNGARLPAIVDVCSHSIGVPARREKNGPLLNAVVIPRNTPLPHRVRKTFRTAYAGQASVEVAIIEGESPLADDCVSVGRCQLRNLPADLPARSCVEVEFVYETNGRLSVSAWAPSLRERARLEIVRPQRRQLDDLTTWRRRLIRDNRRDAAAADNSETSRQRQLDDEFVRQGKKLLAVAVPPELVALQRMAILAEQRRRHAKRTARRMNEQRPEIFSRNEAAQWNRQVAQVAQQYHQAERQSRHALLVLGREHGRKLACPAR